MSVPIKVMRCTLTYNYVKILQVMGPATRYLPRGY